MGFDVFMKVFNKLGAVMWKLGDGGGNLFRREA